MKQKPKKHGRGVVRGTPPSGKGMTHPPADKMLRPAKVSRKGGQS